MTYKTFITSSVLALGFLGSASTASAGELQTQSPDKVVELFTSQGCSSCPPANNFVSKLVDEPGLLALTYGVHYWDYLGWKDTFASPEFTKRQRDYGKAFDSPNVYTPQIVLNGSSHSPRYSKSDVASMTLSSDRPVLTLDQDSGKLTYDVDGSTNYKVVLVSYTPGEQAVPVRRGENGGRTLTLSNVVTDITPLSGSGTTGVTFTPGTRYAALAHDPKTAKIVTAAVYAP